MSFQLRIVTGAHPPGHSAQVSGVREQNEALSLSKVTQDHSPKLQNTAQPSISLTKTSLEADFAS